MIRQELEFEVILSRLNKDFDVIKKEIAYALNKPYIEYITLDDEGESIYLHYCYEKPIKDLEFIEYFAKEDCSNEKDYEVQVERLKKELEELLKGLSYQIQEFYVTIDSISKLEQRFADDEIQRNEWAKERWAELREEDLDKYN